MGDALFDEVMSEKWAADGRTLTRPPFDTEGAEPVSVAEWSADDGDETRARIAVLGKRALVWITNEPMTVAELDAQLSELKDIRAEVAKLHRRPRGTVSRAEAVAAFAVAARRYGLVQSFERFHERGGFSFEELTEFLGHEPETWEPDHG